MTGDVSRGEFVTVAVSSDDETALAFMNPRK